MRHVLHSLSLSRLPTQAFVNGRWCDATDRSTFAVLNPANDQSVANVVDGDGALARAAVDAAADAAALWRMVPAKQRSHILGQLHRLMQDNAEILARIISMEQGKPLKEALAEVEYAAGYVQWFAEEAKRAYGDIVPAPVEGRELLVFKEPVGIVAVITPWNFPLAMLTRKIAPALAAGCTVVAKPASETPLTALALGALAQQAGVPPGVLNIVPTARTSEVADCWLGDPRVRKISFTGSTRIGKLLARESAGTMKRLSLELGGDAPFIIFDDADIGLAIDGLMKAKFRNAGQACIAANRVYVHDAIFDRFCERLIPAVETLHVAPASDPDADIGPLIHRRAAQAMADLVADALSHGAELLTGGTAHPLGGNFFTPTVLAGVTPQMAICGQEIFGPILALSRFEDEDAVVRLANDTPYGLAAYLFSADLRRIWRVARRLEAGIIGINEGAVSTEVAPFGGVKESGYGREGSRHGLADYQQLKYMCLGGLD